MTQSEKECCLVASILECPTAKLGPNACTALASWVYWSSPEASKLAEAIGKVIGRGKVPSRAMVRAVVELQYVDWVSHSSFMASLPVSCLETLAGELLPGYHRKRVMGVISEAYSKCLNWPHDATDIARQLHRELEEVLCVG